MSLTLANPASQPTVIFQTQTVTAVPTTAPTDGSVANSPAIAGDSTNHPPPASATVLIVIGVVLGIVGVAGVITLIWWMRRRALSRYRLQQQLPPLPPVGTRYPPMPPPKSSSGGKALPFINVASANAYQPTAPTRAARSGTADSLNKDKALPIKPVESVWTSPTERQHKSPALTSANELKNQTPKKKTDEEMATPRLRSDSVGSHQPTQPTNFI